MNKIKISCIHDTGFYPPIMNYFMDINEEDIFNSFNNLRHPGGIFNITSTNIVLSLSSLIDRVNDPESDFDTIFNSFRLVIYDFFKFYESCFEIMACFCESDKPIKSRDFIDKWIEKSLKKYKVSIEFKNKLKEDLSVLKNSYNKLKHTSNRLAWICLESDEGSSMGYYLETRDKIGSIATANTIDFPISMFKEIRSIYYLIYKISDVLKETLSEHIAEYNLNIKFIQSKKIVDDEIWMDLFYKVDALSERYFPNETEKVVYKPLIENEKFYFTEDLIDSTNWKENITKFRFTQNHDGYTNVIATPHLGLVDQNLEVIMHPLNGISKGY